MKSDDRLLFLGNPQQSVPKRLLLARNLSPRDKFAWQLLRLHARDDGSGVFPSYNELQGWLSDQPEGEGLAQYRQQCTDDAADHPLAEPVPAAARRAKRRDHKQPLRPA